jgi:hypothetical protein
MSKSSYTVQNVGNFNPEGMPWSKNIVGRCNGEEPTCSDLQLVTCSLQPDPILIIINNGIINQ